MRVIRSIAVVLSSVVLSTVAMAASGPSAGRVSRDAAEGDLREMVQVFADLHPNAFWSRSRADAEAAIGRFVAAIPEQGVPIDDFYREAAAMVVSFDDPHSWVFVPGWRKHLVEAKGGRWPLDLEFRRGRATVRWAPPGSGVPAGAFVEAINGVPMAALYAEMRPLTGQLDDAFGDEDLSFQFPGLLWLTRGWSDGFRVTFRNGPGPQHGWVPAMTQEEYTKAEEAGVKSDALALRMLSPKIAILEFRRCDNADVIRRLAEPIFTKLRDDNVETLLIDARANAGGGDDAWWTLLGYLTDQPTSAYAGSSFRVTPRLRALVGEEGLKLGYGEAATSAKDGELIEYTSDRTEWKAPEVSPLRFAGKWAVLAGPGTFSSGMSFICAVRAAKLAPVVGQATGGRAKGFGQWVRVTLPRTGVQVAVSTKQFNGSIDVPLRHGVPPDVEVAEGPVESVGTMEDPVVRAGILAAR